MLTRSVRSSVAALAVAALTFTAAAPAAASPAGEVNDAMRYGPTAPLGEVIEDLVGEDDSTVTVAAPWPLNFFGERYDGLCITTNGGVYPVVDGNASCSDSYDESVENLASDSEAPMIAVLAADIDLGECDSARVAQRDGAGDGFGRPCTIYLDTAATIDGRDAVVVTWYRVSHNDDVNDETLENTFQVVLTKLPTTDGDTVGYDFDIEFNYGTLKEGDDGYSAADPAEECESLSDDCRWGIGVANWEATQVVEPPVEETSSAASTEPASTEPASTEPASTEAASTEPVPAALEPAAPAEGEPTTDAASREPSEPSEFSPVVATGYEFFADYPVADLLDDGTYALVANSLGTDIDGRYTCGMVSGQTVDCDAVELEAVSPELAETGLTSSTATAALTGLALAFVLVATGMALTRRATASRNGAAAD